MKKLKTKQIVFMITAWALSCFFFQACIETQISLQKELSLGVDEGDENLVFGWISSICFDAEDNIYVLDPRMWRIQKFDSQGTFLKSYAIQDGQGPGEMAVSPQGNPIRSYGEHFVIPQKLAEYDYPSVLYPQQFTVSESERTYVYNPHRYEISAYRNGELETKIKGENAAFWPVSVKNGREVTFTSVSVFESRDRIYSFIFGHGEVPPQLDVFENGQQIKSLDVKGYIQAIDSKGRLYAIVEEPFLQVVRYVVK